MEYDIKHRPSFALAMVRLRAGEGLFAEAGAMVSMDDGIGMETNARGGVMKGLARAFLTNESFFMNTFTAMRDGEISLAPALPGDIMAVNLDEGNTLFVQSGSFLAATTGIEIDTKWEGSKGFFSGKGLVLLRCTGKGTLFLSAYGAIERKELTGGAEYTIDTTHVVAFSDGINYRVTGSGSLKSTLFSGEGLVARYTGQGLILLQTRNFQALVRAIQPHIKKSG